MRVLLIALLAAISYAQTGGSEANGIFYTGTSTKECLTYIEEKSKVFEKHPFHIMLEDESLSNEKRLAGGLMWMPIIMGYSDLNNFVFRNEEKNDDRLQKELNIHTYAEDYHWHWMMEDYRRLGIDIKLDISDVARLLYSPELAPGRQFTHEIIRIETLYPESFHHMSMMKSIEEISLQTTRRYIGFTNKDGEEFEFWGTLHYLAETSHELHEHIDQSSEENSVPLTEPQFKECIYVADRTFRALDILYTHILKFATAFDVENPRKAIEEIIGKSKAKAHNIYYPQYAHDYCKKFGKFCPEEVQSFNKNIEGSDIQQAKDGL